MKKICLLFLSSIIHCSSPEPDLEAMSTPNYSPATSGSPIYEFGVAVIQPNELLKQHQQRLDAHDQDICMLIQCGNAASGRYDENNGRLTVHDERFNRHRAEIDLLKTQFSLVSNQHEARIAALESQLAQTQKVLIQTRRMCVIHSFISWISAQKK